MTRNFVGISVTTSGLGGTIAAGVTIGGVIGLGLGLYLLRGAFATPEARYRAQRSFINSRCCSEVTDAARFLPANDCFSFNCFACTNKATSVQL